MYLVGAGVEDTGEYTCTIPGIGVKPALLTLYITQGRRTINTRSYSYSGVYISTVSTSGIFHCGVYISAVFSSGIFIPEFIFPQFLVQDFFIPEFVFPQFLVQ